MTIYGCAVSRDGRLIAAASDDWTTKVWCTSSGALLFTLTGEDHNPHFDCVFSPCGNMLLTVCPNDSAFATIWDVNTGTCLQTLGVSELAHLPYPCCCAWSPTADIIAVGGLETDVVLWNVNTRTAVATLEGCHDDLQCTAFSPDGTMVAAAGNNNTACIWNVADGGLRQTFSGHRDSVIAGTFAPNQKLLATASCDFTARIWDVNTGEVRRIFRSGDGGHRVGGCAFSCDGKLLSTMSASECMLRLYDTVSGASRGSIPIFDSHFRAIIYCPCAFFSPPTPQPT